MTQITSSLRRDANRVPIQVHGIIETKTITYTATGDGATGALDLFTVTGDVLATVFAVCGTTLTSGAGSTIEVGIAGNIASLIAQTTATDIDANEVWIDTAPATVEALPGDKILTNGTDIIQTVATDTVTAGAITFYCIWTPLSSSANITSA